MGLKRFVGLSVAGSLLASSAVSAAANTPAPQQISPWATLTVLSGGAPAAAMCGSAAATAATQPSTGCVLPVMDTPAPPVAGGPPPAPLPPMAAPAVGYGVSPLLIGLVAIAAAAGLWFAVKNHNHSNAGPPQPNSPG